MIMLRLILLNSIVTDCVRSFSISQSANVVSESLTNRFCMEKTQETNYIEPYVGPSGKFFLHEIGCVIVLIQIYGV